MYRLLDKGGGMKLDYLECTLGSQKTPKYSDLNKIKFSLYIVVPK